MENIKILPVAGSLEAEAIPASASRLPAGIAMSALHHKHTTQSSAPEDGIINKPLLLHLVGCIYHLYQ
jgi:hypothetical protein